MKRCNYVLAFFMLCFLILIDSESVYANTSFNRNVGLKYEKKESTILNTYSLRALKRLEEECAGKDGVVRVTFLSDESEDSFEDICDRYDVNVLFGIKEGKDSYGILFSGTREDVNGVADEFSYLLTDFPGWEKVEFHMLSDDYMGRDELEWEKLCHFGKMATVVDFKKNTLEGMCMNLLQSYWEKGSVHHFSIYPVAGVTRKNNFWRFVLWFPVPLQGLDHVGCKYWDENGEESQEEIVKPEAIENLEYLGSGLSAWRLEKSSDYFEGTRKFQFIGYRMADVSTDDSWREKQLGECAEELLRGFYGYACEKAYKKSSYVYFEITVEVEGIKEGENYVYKRK